MSRVGWQHATCETLLLWLQNVQVAGRLKIDICTAMQKNYSFVHCQIKGFGRIVLNTIQVCFNDNAFKKIAGQNPFEILIR